MDDTFTPAPELQLQLDAATPTPRDFVLYCQRCGWIGETNAAYAADFMWKHKLRIWRHTGPRS
jgi:hypothetical protein